MQPAAAGAEKEPEFGAAEALLKVVTAAEIADASENVAAAGAAVSGSAEPSAPVKEASVPAAEPEPVPAAPEEKPAEAPAGTGEAPKPEAAPAPVKKPQYPMMPQLVIAAEPSEKLP